jgi:hypothetical protein
MSAIWSLKGEKRTSRRQPNLVAIDPQRTSDCAVRNATEFQMILTMAIPQIALAVEWAILPCSSADSCGPGPLIPIRRGFSLGF